MARAGQLQMWGLANTNATTEGYGFLGLLYGGHAGLSNLSRFNLPEFNRLYESSRRLPDGPERTKLFREMSALVTAYAPWMLDVYRYENVVVYPWVVGYKYNGIYAASMAVLRHRSRRASACRCNDAHASRDGWQRFRARRRSARCWRSLARSAAAGAAEMGRSGEDAARDVPDRRDRLRSAGDVRLLLVARAARDLRLALRFDYLARPYRFVPNTAAAMPEISADGRTWTIRIKPGIHFADDPAFKGKKRELTADDYVYAWKRLLDPRMRAPFLWYLDGKVVGADAVLAKAKEAGRLDYDAPIEGLKALDRYTLRLTLKEPDYVMLGYMSQAPMAAVAREVIEAYGDASGWAMANPVGTGPYRLAEWRRGQKIVLDANPGLSRGCTFRTNGEPGRPRARSRR